MPDLPLLLEAVEEDIKDAEEIIGNDSGPLTEPDLSNASSELDQADAHAADALQDPTLVNLVPTFLGTPWPSGANNKVALAVQWSEEASTGSDQDKADRLGSVREIITFIKTDIEGLSR